MRGRSPLQSIAASPTMVGAITTLIVMVAVFLAYNANNGLPFVPVYRVSVEVPNAARLIRNNEVRIGGHRIGVVESIDVVAPTGEEATDPPSEGEATDEEEFTGSNPDQAVARLNLKLDRTAQPLPVDSTFRVRYRSAFGLKYLDIQRGTGEGAPEGYLFDNPAQFIPQTEFDDIANTFDSVTRENSRINLVGFGNAFAGRGLSLNDAIGALDPLVENLGPVAKILTARNTQLKRFFPALATAARIVAPVAAEQAELFTNAAATFAALSADPQALQDGIVEGVPTLETAIESLPRTRPFIQNFITLSKALAPGVRNLVPTLPILNDAILTGTPVLKRTPATARDLETVFRELEQLVENPGTALSLKRLEGTFDTARPLAQFVAPAQTVCNYWNYTWANLSNSFTDFDGTGWNLRQILIEFPQGGTRVAAGTDPLNSISVTIPPPPGGASSSMQGYSGVQANGRTFSLGDTFGGEFEPFELPIAHGNVYGPAGQEDADCQIGQLGYPLGQGLLPGQSPSNPAYGVPDIPGSRGPTTSFNLQDGTRILRDTRVPSRQPPW